MSQGQPAAARSMNFEGLKRRGFSAERVSAVKTMHKYLYRENHALLESIEKIKQIPDAVPESKADVDLMVAFLTAVNPSRGIVR